MKHHTPIITNARQGKPLSTGNRKRGTGRLMLIFGCALFWLAVAVLILT